MATSARRGSRSLPDAAAPLPTRRLPALPLDRPPPRSPEAGPRRCRRAALQGGAADRGGEPRGGAEAGGGHAVREGALAVAGRRGSVACSVGGIACVCCVCCMHGPSCGRAVQCSSCLPGGRCPCMCAACGWHCLRPASTAQPTSVSTPCTPAPPALLQAYCLYRLGRLQDALAALGAVSADAEAARLQLEAQVQYRLGNCKEAIALYSQLFRAHGGEATADVRPNVLAAYVAGGRGGEVPAVMQAMKVGAGVGWAVATCSAAPHCTLHASLYCTLHRHGSLRCSAPWLAARRSPRATRSSWPLTRPAPWRRAATWRARRSSCSWPCAWVRPAGGCRKGGRAMAGTAGAPPARWLPGRAAPRDAGGSRRAFLGVGCCRR